MKTRFSPISLICLITTIWLIGNQNALGQGFKGLVPLESSCEDIKRVLGVEKCEPTRQEYELKDFRVSFSFVGVEGFDCNSRWCYKAPAGSIGSITVFYHKPVPIKEFDYELKFPAGPLDESGTMSYQNEEAGVYVFTNAGSVSTADFVPTPEQHKKLAYPHRPIRRENNFFRLETDPL